jgi:DNA polymerase-1
MTPERPTLTLIDGSSYIFRAYHAIPHLSTSRGVPTNAVYGFTLMLLKALREGEPTHVAIAFDKEARTFRQAIDPAYKANRPPTPLDLVQQFPLIRQVVQALHVPVLELSGYEADDIIATLARRAVAQGFQVLVITGDKDFMQLVGEHVELYDSMSDKHTRVSDVPERIGVRPDQVVEYMALVGDDIDNVPGVPKVGPKTAAALVQRFGTVENLLEHVDEVPATGIRGAKGIAEQIRLNADQLKRAKRLVTLQADLALPQGPEDFARRLMDESAVRKLFGELEFTRLLRELPPPPITAARTLVERVLDAEALEALAARLAGADAFALRTFCDGARPRTDALVGLAFSLGGGVAWYVPLAHHYLGVPRQLDRALVAQKLRPFLEDPAKAKHGHDLKADSLALAQLGIELKGLACDAELASYLLNAARREHALADLSRERLGVELPGDVRLAPGGRRRSACEVAVEEGAAFAGSCAEAAWGLSQKLMPELEEQKLLALFRDLELPLVPVLARMELAGVRVDQKALARVDAEVVALLRRQEQEVYRCAGREFNINSNPQLATVLFDELKLPVLRRGKTGPSADQEVLEKLAQQHPLPRAILEFRSLFKLKGTYLDALPALIEKDGRIHTSFHQATAATGRLSSSDPNLQNVPIRSELGRKVREAFVADEGAQFVSADYSQIELRVLAHVSQDEALLEAFARDEDVHTRTAAEVFGVKAQEVTELMRRTAKAINFGIAYGLSAYGLGQRLDLPGKEAQAIIDRYFQRYRGVRAWLDQTIAQVKETAEVATMFGRRRFVAEIHSRNPATRMGAERIAVNTPIQGAAADLIKRAMIEVDRRLQAQALKARLLLQVHDELLVEAPEAEVEAAKALVVEAMAGAGALSVPLKVEVGVGKSWAAAH